MAQPWTFQNNILSGDLVNVPSDVAIAVVLYKKLTASNIWLQVDYITTDSKGRWSFQILTSGFYSVRFYGGGLIAEENNIENIRLDVGSSFTTSNTYVPIDFRNGGFLWHFSDSVSDNFGLEPSNTNYVGEILEKEGKFTNGLAVNEERINQFEPEYLLFNEIDTSLKQEDVSSNYLYKKFDLPSVKVSLKSENESFSLLTVRKYLFSADNNLVPSRGTKVLSFYYYCTVGSNLSIKPLNANLVISSPTQILKNNQTILVPVQNGVWNRIIIHVDNVSNLIDVNVDLEFILNDGVLPKNITPYDYWCFHGWQWEDASIASVPIVNGTSQPKTDLKYNINTYIQTVLVFWAKQYDFQSSEKVFLKFLSLDGETEIPNFEIIQTGKGTIGINYTYGGQVYTLDGYFNINNVNWNFIAIGWDKQGVIYFMVNGESFPVTIPIEHLTVFNTATILKIGGLLSNRTWEGILNELMILQESPTNISINEWYLSDSPFGGDLSDEELKAYTDNLFQDARTYSDLVNRIEVSPVTITTLTLS